MQETAPHFKIGVHVSDDAMNTNNEKVCELYFTDAIYNKVNWWSGEEVSMLRECIDKVNEIKPTKIIQYIDSWGGSAPVGFGIYNYLKGHSAKVETKILNNCASIATVMSSAGNKGKIIMPRNGMMVIHQAQNSAQGTAAELREAADVCDKYTENVLDVYVQNNRKGKTRDELYALIKDGDYWMTGTEAKEMGFVDDCYNDAAVTITNSIAKARTVYNNIPQRILDMASVENSVVEEPVQTENLFTKLKNYLDMKVSEIVAKFKTDLPNNGVVGEGNKTIDIAALLEAPITNMLTAIQESITNDIATASTAAIKTVTDNVGNIETKYKELINSIITEGLSTLTETVNKLTGKVDEQAGIITAQANIITEQHKTIDTITADVTRIQGRPAAAAGAETEEATGNGSNKKPKTFKGLTQAVNVAD